jgi:hypothetical protein
MFKDDPASYVFAGACVSLRTPDTPDKKLSWSDPNVTAP